jgi:preprotein translocase subunit SecG
MVIVLTILHVIICVFLVIVVLLQSGKAADLAGAFGGMGSQTAFGPRGGATLLSRATTVAAAMFMVTSLGLAIMATRGGGGPGTKSVLEQTKDLPKKNAPTVPSGAGTGIPNGQPSIQITPPGGGKPETIKLPVPPPPLTDAGKQSSQPAAPSAPAQKK